MKKQIIILRGLPGSGKSTFAIELLKEHGINSELDKYICCTDDFFYNDGIYKFIPQKLSEYHSKNLCKFIHRLKSNLPIVICDNTNIKKWEYKAYEEIGMCFGYDIKIKTVGKIKSLDFQHNCFKNNKHGVLLKAIRTMANAFEV